MRRLIVPFLLAGLLLGGCVSPARTSEQYSAKARSAVQAATGEVATATMVATQWRDERSTGPYTDEVLTSSETTLGSIGGAFGSVQPPDPTDDGLRSGVGESITAAQDAVAQARIVVRRGHRDDMDEPLRLLDEAAKDLDTALEATS